MLAALLLAAGQPAAVPPTMGVPELSARHVELTGQRVRVRGWLAECQTLSCILVEEGRTVAQGPWISFADAPAFDRAARPAIGRTVVVEGIVLDHCWPAPPGSLLVGSICTDRADQFRPLRIVQVLPGAKDGH